MPPAAEEDDVEAFFDGIFEDGSEPSPRSGAAPRGAGAAQAPRAAPRGGADDDLFGDFSGEEDQSNARTKGQKRKKDAAGKFFELEAEEAGAGSGDEEDGDVEGLIDDSEVVETTGGGGNKRFRLEANSEVADLRRDMESRGPETGARRVFGGDFLDRLQDKYQEDEEPPVEAQPEPRRQQASVQQRFREARRDAVETVTEHKPMMQTFLPRAAAPVPELNRVQEQAMLPEEEQEQYDRRDRPRKAQIREVKNTNTHIVPTAGDPKLWRCKTYADEKALCTALMLKASDMFIKGQEPPIFSVFYSAHQRGYIYMEAFREAVIRTFIKGIRGISPWSIVVVPVAQMPQVFTSCLTDASFKSVVKVGDWVRMRRKPYTGDLARIEEIRDQEYTVKLKPRIQYRAELAEKAGDKMARDSRKRPASRWFNKTDLESAGMMVSVTMQASARGTMHYYQVEEDIFRDGFVYKTLRVAGLETGEEVRPQEHEVQDWQFAPAITGDVRPLEDEVRPEEEERKLMPPPSMIPTKAQQRLRAEPLVDGDMVIVNRGELINLRGRIVKVVTGVKTVTVRPVDVGVSQDIELSIDTLCKYFEVGDYVLAISGSHAGEAGYVMKLNYTGLPDWHADSICSVLSSNLTVEFEARLDEVQLTSKKTEQVMEHGEFIVGGLVQLQSNSGSRAIIVRIETSFCGGKAEVLLPTGGKQFISLAQLSAINMERRDLNKLWTLDRKENVISPGCVVKAPRGQQKAAPVRAQIIFIHNEICFLKAEEGLTGERAFLVCSGKKVELIYNSKDQKDLERGGTIGKPQQAPEQTQNIQAALDAVGSAGYGKMASETEWMQEWFKKMMGIEDGGGKCVSQEGAAVRILGGDYKGLRAEVRANLGDKVRLSLLCKPKLVTVPMQFVAPDDFSNNPKRMKRRLGNGYGSAPTTPARSLMDGNGASQPGTPLGDFAADFSPMTERPLAIRQDNAWDPTYLMQDANKGAKHGDFGGRSEPAAPFGGSSTPRAGSTTPRELAASLPVPSSPVPSFMSGASNASARKRKRKSVLPDDPVGEPQPGSVRPQDEGRNGGGSTPRPGDGARTPNGLPSPAYSPTLEAVPAAGKPEGKGAQQSGLWAIPGVGVQFQTSSGPRPQWVLDVLDGGNRLRVVPSTAAVGDEDLSFDIPASAATPWHCDGRGDVVGVSGPQKGSKGKVIGIEVDVAYLRQEGKSRNKTSLAFASTSCKDLLTVKRQDLAKFNAGWVKAHADNLLKPKDGLLDDESVAGDGPITFEGDAEAELERAPVPTEAADDDDDDDWVQEARQCMVEEMPGAPEEDPAVPAQLEASAPTPTGTPAVQPPTPSPAGGWRQSKLEAMDDGDDQDGPAGVHTPSVDMDAKVEAKQLDEDHTESKVEAHTFMAKKEEQKHDEEA